MRKSLRMLMLALVLLVVPGANAIVIDCVPGIWVYHSQLGWKCFFWDEGTHCMICHTAIDVIG